MDNNDNNNDDYVNNRAPGRAFNKFLSSRLYCKSRRLGR